MSEWIERLHDKHVTGKGDEAMEALKRDIAVQHHLVWKDSILKRLQNDIIEFNTRLGVDRVGGPKEVLGRYWEAGTKQDPRQHIRLEFKLDCIHATKVSLKPITGEYSDKPEILLLRIKAAVDGNTWVEYSGTKFLDVAEVSEFLLKEVMEAAAI